VPDLSHADVGIGQHRLGGLDVVVGQFRRAASCAANTPRGGRARLGALPDEAAVYIDGVRIEIRGIRALHVPPAATRIEFPSFRNPSGRSQAAIILREEVRGPIGDAVLGQLVERGLAVKRSVLTANSAGP